MKVKVIESLKYASAKEEITQSLKTPSKGQFIEQDYPSLSSRLKGEISKELDVLGIVEISQLRKAPSK